MSPQARAASDAKGTFMASMSHEMRTPLNGVLGMLQLAMAYDLPKEVMQNVQNAYMSGMLIHFQLISGFAADAYDAHEWYALHICPRVLLAGEHLLNLVNDVLDVSKIEAGKLELEWKPFSVKDVFRTAMDIVRPQALSKGETRRAN